MSEPVGNPNSNTPSNGASARDDKGNDEPTAGTGVIGEHEQHRLFIPLVFLGGFVFGIGLAVSRMARPEIVLEFLQFKDFGLLFVMGGAAIVFGIVGWALRNSGRQAPLTGQPYGRRLKSMDRTSVIGGGLFGVGWGISGICPGAAYASLGIGNVVILYGVAGMFLGAYLQGYLRGVQNPLGSEATPE